MPKRSTKFYRKNEEQVMRQLGFKPTINSGAGWIQKEDGENEQCLCQLKSTDNRSISIKQTDLHTLENNSAVAHKLPVFAIQFLNTGEVWVMVKPEHLSLLKSLTEGNDISSLLPDINEFEEILSSSKESVDISEEECYNSFVQQRDADKEAYRAYIARKEYYEEKQRTAEQRNKEYRERVKGKWKRNLSKKE